MIAPAWLAPHMPIVFGLLMGTVTKFGMAYESGQLTPRKAVSQLSMLGTLGLIVVTTSDLVSTPPTARAVAAAVAALLGAKLIDRYVGAADRVTATRLSGDPQP